MADDLPKDLMQFYARYREAIKRTKGSKGPPLFIKQMLMKSNDRSDLLRASSIDGKDVDYSALRTLLEEGVVQETDERSKYTITGRGVWLVESQSGVIQVSELIDHLDERYFRFAGAAPPLTEREKVILLALIAGRAFSDVSAVDLQSDELTKDGWQTIVGKALDELRELGVVKKLSKRELLEREGNEVAVSHLIRHTDALPKKTRGLYVAGGRQRYYLSLGSPDVINTSDLTYILRRILERNVPPSRLDRVNSFLRDVAYTDALKVFDLRTHRYATPAVDEVVHEAVRQAVLHPESST